MQSKPIQRAKDVFTEDEMAELRTLSDLRGWLGITHCWAVILLTWVAVAIWTNPLTVLLGILIIGTRQLGLFVLSHDCAHMTMFETRWLNDWASEWLMNRPLTGTTVYGYRKYHVNHHQHTQQSEDPDLHLTAPFPISKQSFRRKVWRDLSGQTGWKQYGAMFRQPFVGATLALRLRSWLAKVGPNLAINLVFFAAFALAGVWYLYFLLWWVPALTWNRFVTRLRNIGEHAAVPDNDDRLRNTRTTRASWLERAFVAPYRVNFHLEHHLLVSCPYYRLPRAHQMLMAKGLEPQMEIRNGYRSVLQQALVQVPA